MGCDAESVEGFDEYPTDEISDHATLIRAKLGTDSDQQELHVAGVLPLGLCLSRMEA